MQHISIICFGQKFFIFINLSLFLYLIFSFFISCFVLSKFIIIWCLDVGFSFKNLLFFFSKILFSIFLYIFFRFSLFMFLSSLFNFYEVPNLNFNSEKNNIKILLWELYFFKPPIYFFIEFYIHLYWYNKFYLQIPNKKYKISLWYFINF